MRDYVSEKKNTLYWIMTHSTGPVQSPGLPNSLLVFGLCPSVAMWPCADGPPWEVYGGL